MVFLTLSLRRWMLGATPLVRTVKYLEAEPIYFRDAVQVMLAHFNENQASSEGLKQFCVWSIPQIQYRNPNVQINIVKGITPSPWVQFFLHDPHTEVEESVLVDCHTKTREQITDHVRRILGKTEKMLRREEMKEAAKSANPANFGYDCGRWCMCEVDGQVPCSGQETIPVTKRWKYNMKPSVLKEDEEEFLEHIDRAHEYSKEHGFAFVPTFPDCGRMDVYHEQNVKRYHEWVDKVTKRIKGGGNDED